MKLTNTLLASVLGASTLFSASVMASENHTVTASAVAFDPIVIRVQPGDTVSWRNMATHNTATMDEFIPEGAPTWASQMSADFTTPPLPEGIYLYKCEPHWGMAMGGAIIVGEPINYDAIEEAKPRGATNRIWKKVKAELGK